MLYEALKLVCYLIKVYVKNYSHHYFNDTKKIDESLQVTSEPIFISDFNLLSCKLENFTLKVL